MPTPAPAPSTAAFRDVELVTVGTFAASTGVTTVTRADLDDMLAAAGDRVIDAAPIKLGHASSLNDAIGDGEPAFGWVQPTRIGTGASGRDTLFGNLVAMPAQLAAIAPSAYRRRSVEIAWGVKAGGKTYKAVLTAVSLLGATKPAIKDLADLVALYAAPAITADRTSALELVDGLDGNVVAVAMLTAARDAGADDAQLEHLAAAAGARDTANLPAPTPEPSQDAPNATTTTTGGAPMPEPTTTPTSTPAASLTDQRLRELLSLEADADVEAALRELVKPPTTPATPATPPAATPPASGDPATPAPPASTTDPAAPASTPTLEPAVASLSAGALAELQTDAAWARNERRARILDTAVQAGKITPAERGKLTAELAAGETVSGFAAALERDEAGTTGLINTLVARFPTSELGADAAPTTNADAAFDRFEAETFGLDRTPAAS